MRRVVKDTRGGQTLYFGARSSERFGRLYDKGIESKSHGAGQRWRWEVEAKDGAARTFAAALKAADDAASFIQGAVAGFFWARAGVGLAEITRSLIPNETRKEPRSDQLLKWLSIGVRPTVAKLVKVYGRERVLTALGLLQSRAVDAPSPSTVQQGAQQWPPQVTSTR